MPLKTILKNIGGTIKTVTEFVEDEVIDPISNQIEYGVDEFRQGNPAPVLNAMSLGMSGAMAPLTQAVRGVDETEGTLLESVGNYVEDKTGIPSLVTQVAAGVLIPGPGEYKAAGKSIARGVKKAFPLEGLDNIARGGPPTPQLATAGAAPRVQLNVSRGKANLQVMEARAKPGMTQEQWDTQRGAEIRAKRDKVSDAKVAMENIEASNPGVPKNVLKAKDMGGSINEKGKYTDGYKSQQRRYEDGQAEVSSAESNIPVPTPDNPYAFPRDTLGAKQFKEEVGIANEALGRAVEQLELHHLIPKGMSAAIYNRARDFIEKGLVDPKYLNRIAEKFKKITGADTGDLRSGILPMRNTPHKTYHNEMRFQPSDTFPGESMEIMKEALTTKLNQINNPKDFEILLDNLIKNDIKPLVDNARIWEKSDDVIRSVSPDFTGRALPNVLKKRKAAAKKTRQKKTNK